MKRFSHSLAMAALVTLSAWLAIALVPWVDLEQDFGLPWLYRLRGPVPAPGDVMVVAIDEQSAESLGLSEQLRQWPRSLHAQLVRRLAALGARLIVFDLSFDARGPQPREDAELAAAIAAAGNVLATESLRKETLALDDTVGKPVASVVIERELLPIPAIEQALLGHAPFILPKMARVDAYWTFRNGDIDSPTLAVLALRHWVSAGAPGRAEQRLTRLHAAGDSAYLNLYGPPRSIPTLSYSRVLQVAPSLGQAAAATAPDVDAVRGKAVFVGYSAATPAWQDRLRDDHRTVFSRADGLNLSGVEIAATAFANLLEGRELQPVATAWQLAIAVAWAIALTIVFVALRPVAAAAVAAGLGLAWLALVLERFTNAASWWPSIVPIGVQIPLALLIGVWLHDRQSRHEREAIERAFGYFLPRSVVDQLATGDGSVTRGNRVVFGCCLATDVSKYTTLAEHMEPARLGQLLNDYFAELFVPVERSGGVIVDVVGDAMVAIWTAPAPDVALRRKACEAALEAVAAVDRFNRSRAGRPALVTRFGLHCGEVMIGSVGASQHYEYRAVGDMINTASRLEGLNKLLGTRLLVSVQMVQGLDDLCTRPLGRFRLAGKAIVLDVLELLDATSAADASARRRRETFAQALALHDIRRWQDAAGLFAAILSDHPDDGPSRFYLERCRWLSSAPPDDGWGPTVEVDVK